MNEVTFDVLMGQTITSIINEKENIVFNLENGDSYSLFHAQDCCEHVYVEDIVGLLSDLIGSPITLAEEPSNRENPKNHGVNDYVYTDESCTWTFYRLATIKGYVDIRWYGHSNGYYSESVSFVKLPNENYDN